MKPKEARLFISQYNQNQKSKGEWKVAVRYDCSHGFSHIDKYDIKGNKTKKTLNLSFESALTYGDWDINENWLKYKQEFLKGVSNEQPH